MLHNDLDPFERLRLHKRLIVKAARITRDDFHPHAKRLALHHIADVVTSDLRKRAPAKTPK